MAEKGTVQSLDRAFDILEALCAAREGLAIREIVERTGLNKSTVHRMLQSMAARGYVTQEEESGRYRMTTLLYAMSSQVVDSLDLVQAARRPMEGLSQRVGETVHLVVPEGTEIVYVHKVEADTGAIRMVSRIGTHRPMYCTGGGKAILASMEDGEVDRIWAASQIQAYTPRTITDRGALQAALEEVRRQGYAFDDEENELEVRCVAAAIRDYTGGVCGALSISAPVQRLSGRQLSRLCPLLLETRDRIARSMGWRG